MKKQFKKAIKWIEKPVTFTNGDSLALLFVVISVLVHSIW